MSGFVVNDGAATAEARVLLIAKAFLHETEYCMLCPDEHQLKLVQCRGIGDGRPRQGPGQAEKPSPAGRQSPLPAWQEILEELRTGIYEAGS